MDFGSSRFYVNYRLCMLSVCMVSPIGTNHETEYTREHKGAYLIRSQFKAVKRLKTENKPVKSDFKKGSTSF